MVLLHEQLKDSDFAKAYINEALHDADPNVLLLVLRDILEAKGEDVSALAKKAHISRQNIYRMLSEKGNPRWNNIRSLMTAMGFQVHVK